MRPTRRSLMIAAAAAGAGPLLARLPARAEEAARHGISSFGDLAYPADFRHFAYVNPAAPKGGTFIHSASNWAYNQNANTFNTLNTWVLRGDAPLPQVGTIAEAGFPGFSVTSWMGLVAPANLPQPIAQRLNRELNEIVAEPATVDRIHTLGSEPKAGSPQDFARRIAADIERWNKVIDEAKIERI